MRVLIVDDEQIAREGVRTLLEREPDIQVVGECGDGHAALRAILRDRVDCVLLDIQMPGMDGFAVLRELPPRRVPVIVFLTAYDQHALRAFDAHALDYVVKPFSDARFRAAIDRARTQVRHRRLGESTNELASLVASLRVGASASLRYLTRIPVRSVGRTTYVRVDELSWIGAADYYAELHTVDGRRHLVRESMRSLESLLDPTQFVRTHRSAIANVEHVIEIRTVGNDRQIVMLRDGTKLPLGRSRRGALEQVLARR